MRPEAELRGEGGDRSEVLPFATSARQAREEEADPLRRELRPILRRLAAVLEDLILFVIRARRGGASTGATGRTPTDGESGDAQAHADAQDARDRRKGDLRTGQAGHPLRQKQRQSCVAADAQYPAGRHRERQYAEVDSREEARGGDCHDQRDAFADDLGGRLEGNGAREDSRRAADSDTTTYVSRKRFHGW